MYGWIGILTSNLRGLQRIGRLLPKVVILFSCYAASRVVYYCMQSLARSWMNTMRDLMPNKPAADIRSTCKAYIFHVMLTLYEIIVDEPDREGNLDRRFTMEGEGYLQQALSRGRGAILFAPHMGNFFYYYWHLSRHYRCMTVVTAGSKELRPIYMRFKD